MKRNTCSKPATYQIIEMLGEGLTSCVYKSFKISETHNLNTLVALKILKSQSFIQEWKQEILSLQSVSHENLVQIRGWEELDLGFTIVLEFIDGLSLAQLLKQEMELTHDEKNCLFQQAHIGLQKLHQIGLVHGDVSPNNIIIDKYGTVKWIDYGFGNFQSQKKFTPQFASPEVIQGSQCTSSSDLYSLAKLANLLFPEECHIRETLSSPPQIRNISFLTKNFLEAKKGLSNKIELALLNLEENKTSLKTELFTVTTSTSHLNSKTDSNTSSLLAFQPVPITTKKSPTSLHKIKGIIQWKLKAFTLSLIFISSIATTNSRSNSTISLATLQWSKVYLDEKYIGTSPIISYPTTVGSHKIDLEFDHSQKTIQVQLKAGNNKISVRDEIPKKLIK